MLQKKKKNKTVFFGTNNTWKLCRNKITPSDKKNDKKKFFFFDHATGQKTCPHKKRCFYYFEIEIAIFFKTSF